MALAWYSRESLRNEDQGRTYLVLGQPTKRRSRAMCGCCSGSSERTPEPTKAKLGGPCISNRGRDWSSSFAHLLSFCLSHTRTRMFVCQKTKGICCKFSFGPDGHYTFPRVSCTKGISSSYVIVSLCVGSANTNKRKKEGTNEKKGEQISASNYCYAFIIHFVRSSTTNVRFESKSLVLYLHSFLRN